MKNQYVGDVGDYGKYGLLRYISNKGIHIGVNWYLTEDDGSNDGKFISYLSKESERKYDGELYDFLKEIIEKEKNLFIWWNREIYYLEKFILMKN